ncbi:MAG: polysaccharide deacetylase family protein [Bacteroidales bacterium]|nr:polysaccharide deacetylase family protein [Bacteroidales bacterium]MBN2755940.1 polysaccharide deacetylase family protein [Bacteroidales bacterium]
MENNKSSLLIYVPVINNRNEYAFDLIFNNILKLKYKLIDDFELFKSSKEHKLIYSYTDDYDEEFLFLKANNLLFEDSIFEIEIDLFNWQSEKVFFKSSEKSIIPFDIFSASFYLVSRYEEYLPLKKDKHNRFSAENSIAFKNGFLEKPIINIWSKLFKIELIKHFPDLHFGKNKFKFISTIDIDNASAHLQKGFIRNLLSYFQLILNLNFKEIVKKTKVLAKIEKDPFDNFDFLNKVHEKYNYKPIYFILFSKYSKFDKNLSVFNKYFVNLINKISEKYEIAIHPSYYSNRDLKILETEKLNLENTIGKKINKSRQHYLKIEFPKTYKNLIKIGICEDYSMGYSNYCGFRAGTCNSFYYFDLEQNIKTNLKIIPFAVMDLCLINNSIINQKELINRILNNLKQLESQLVSLWHNDYLNSKNAQNIFEEMLKKAKAFEKQN